MRFASVFVVSISLALATGGALARTDSGNEGDSYVVPTADGYGISECMQTASDCGRVMADSWCEAHGHAHAIAYGMGEDVTGALVEPPAGVTKISASDVVIRCGD